MTSCRYCTHSNGTWIRSLQKITYACREGKNTRKANCKYFQSSDDDIENIYQGSVQDTWA